MNYTLMHKELPVTDMELDETTAAVLKIGQVYHPEHLPVGVGIKNGVVPSNGRQHPVTGL